MWTCGIDIATQHATPAMRSSVCSAAGDRPSAVRALAEPGPAHLSARWAPVRRRRRPAAFPAPVHRRSAPARARPGHRRPALARTTPRRARPRQPACAAAPGWPARPMARQAPPCRAAARHRRLRGRSRSSSVGSCCSRLNGPQSPGYVVDCRHRNFVYRISDRDLQSGARSHCEEGEPDEQVPDRTVCQYCGAGP